MPYLITGKGVHKVVQWGDDADPYRAIGYKVRYISEDEMYGKAERTYAGKKDKMAGRRRRARKSSKRRYHPRKSSTKAAYRKGYKAGCRAAKKRSRKSSRRRRRY